MKKNSFLFALLLMAPISISLAQEVTYKGFLDINSEITEGHSGFIVNQSNPIGTMEPSDAAAYYLRKSSSRWKGLNKSILPADRKGEPETKKIFMKENPSNVHY